MVLSLTTNNVKQGVNAPCFIIPKSPMYLYAVVLLKSQRLASFDAFKDGLFALSMIRK